MPEKVKFLFTPKERFELLRAFYDAGILPALYDALIMCEEFGFPPPEWAIKGARNAVGDRLLTGKPTGSTSAIIQPGNYRAMMKRLRRWQVVKMLQLKGSKIPKVFEEAENDLGKKFGGSVTASAIEDSYYKVENALKNPTKKFQYYTLITETSDLTETPKIYPKK